MAGLAEGGGALSFLRDSKATQNFPVAHIILPQHGLLVLWESSKNQFGRPKKSRQRFEIF